MRRKVAEQLGLVTIAGDHVRAQELAVMSVVLDELQRCVDLVYRDLVSLGGKTDTGREAMTAEQVLRATIIKQRFDCSYDELAFHIADSNTVRAFCRIPLSMSPPTKSTLQRNIKPVKATTWEEINGLVIGYAQKTKIETGRKTRSDCTVVGTNILEPSDSRLLWDCVRVLARLMTKAERIFRLPFKNRCRRAKRRALGVLNAKSKEQRLPLYRDLLKVTGETMAEATRVSERLQTIGAGDTPGAPVAQSIQRRICEIIGHAKHVVDQTERRILREENVPAREKIVSIFEPHTDIIVKDRRDTFYGHKVCLTSGASGLVLDLVVETGNPADVTLATKMVKRVATVLGKVPKQVTFDGAFASKANVKAPCVREVVASAA